MPSPARVRVFASDSPDYHTAFNTFLEHTDQKDQAWAWLDREVNRLARRRVLVDAGAGTGKLTAWLLPKFQSVVAIEPNQSLQQALRQSCPTASVRSATMLEVAEPLEADFVLCSHVFYYLPRAEWDTNLRQLAGWLAVGGVLAVAIQNPRTDCMQMLAHFVGQRRDLAELCPVAEALPTGGFRATLETVPARIEALDRNTACAIAEFILNVMPIPSPPAWDNLERYVEQHFRRADGAYRFSCDQDFLRVVRSA